MSYACYSFSYTCDLTLLRQAVAKAGRSEHHVTSMLQFAYAVFGNDQCIHPSHASLQDVDILQLLFSGLNNSTDDRIPTS
jgi:hypothetical protein